MEISYAVEWTSQGHYPWFYLEAGRTAMLEIQTLAGVPCILFFAIKFSCAPSDGHQPLRRL